MYAITIPKDVERRTLDRGYFIHIETITKKATEGYPLKKWICIRASLERYLYSNKRKKISTEAMWMM